MVSALCGAGPALEGLLPKQLSLTEAKPAAVRAVGFQSKL